VSLACISAAATASSEQLASGNWWYCQASLQPEGRRHLITELVNAPAQRTDAVLSAYRAFVTSRYGVLGKWNASCRGFATSSEAVNDRFSLLDELRARGDNINQIGWSWPPKP
jgi:hypothetical protein